MVKLFALFRSLRPAKLELFTSLFNQELVSWAKEVPTACFPLLRRCAQARRAEEEEKVEEEEEKVQKPQQLELRSQM